jgi:hypothetical protein
VCRALDGITDAICARQHLGHHLIGVESNREIGIDPEEYQEEEGAQEEAALEGVKPLHGSFHNARLRRNYAMEECLKTQQLDDCQIQECRFRKI